MNFSLYCLCVHLEIVYRLLVDATYQSQTNVNAFANDIYRRAAPQAPTEGTVNWERMRSGSTMFSPRHSHASCTYKCPSGYKKQCIWLTGGRSETYRTWELQYEDRNADVWWTEDGATWNKEMKLYGDFLDGIGNFDAKVGGQVAPWYSRYGHSLNALDSDGDSEPDAMVLAGGFNPTASNDVWITIDGSTWMFDGYAPWPPRAYHASAVFNRQLWILGGTPLRNDVWSGSLVRKSSGSTGYKMQWKLQVPHLSAPWAPRAGMCALTQLRRNWHAPLETSVNNKTNTLLNVTEYMFMVGGVAGWPRDDIRYNGDRCRNDVWVTTDGTEWERVLPPEGMTTMPFGARAWHACVTWHNPHDRSRAVIAPNTEGYSGTTHDQKLVHPRMYITGGGYTGTKGNNIVRSLEGYIDTWWSTDGSIWNRIDYEEGRKDSLYSTNEWSLLTLDNYLLYLGKWGHTLESFTAQEDLNGDGEISNTSTSLRFCGNQTNVDTCRVFSVNEDAFPALLLIGGDTVDNGPMVNDVFISRPGVHCEINGVTCSGRGLCSPGYGCVCNSDVYEGEYCESFSVSLVSSAERNRIFYGTTVCLIILVLVPL